MTVVVTGNAVRAYELAAHLRARGIRVVLGGPHVTLVPDDAAPHADAIVVEYAEDAWPALPRDFAAGRMAPRYDQAPDLDVAAFGAWRPLNPPVTHLPRRSAPPSARCRPLDRPLGTPRAVGLGIETSSLLRGDAQNSNSPCGGARAGWIGGGSVWSPR